MRNRESGAVAGITTTLNMVAVGREGAMGEWCTTPLMSDRGRRRLRIASSTTARASVREAPTTFSPLLDRKYKFPTPNPFGPQPRPPNPHTRLEETTKSHSSSVFSIFRDSAPLPWTPIVRGPEVAGSDCKGGIPLQMVRTRNDNSQPREVFITARKKRHDRYGDAFITV